VATPHALKEITPEKVESLLQRYGTQARVARKLGVSQGSLSEYMKKHGFIKIESWQRKN
jgi:predicted transcriptional regulator